MSGLSRLRELKEEIERIKEKKKLAEEMGVKEASMDTTPLDLDAVEKLLEELRKEIGQAAIVEAHREIQNTVQEAQRIRDGYGPRIPAGPADKDGGTISIPRVGRGSRPDGRGEGDDSSEDDNEKECCCCPGCLAAAIAIAQANANASAANGGGGGNAESVCVYVRSDITVWAWDRRTQTWKEYSNGSGIVDVKLIKGGILAVAEQGAAIFDCGLGEWLTELSSAPEDLVEGGGNT